MKLDEAEDEALDMVKRARNLDGIADVLRVMSITEAVQEAERLRKDLAVAG